MRRRGSIILILVHRALHAAIRVVTHVSVVIPPEGAFSSPPCSLSISGHWALSMSSAAPGLAAAGPLLRQLSHLHSLLVMGHHLWDGRDVETTVARMAWIISAAGLLVVLVALRDIFHTLWHPAGFGRITQWVFQLVWWATKHVVPSRTRHLAGPTAVVGTVMLWTGTVVVGWTLVYLAHMPQGFYFGSALRPGQSSDALAALYLSLVTVVTLGFGDITPADPVLRLLTPFEALVGFVLLTAAISWILQIYPALGRRRSVAKRLSILKSTQASEVVTDADPDVASRMLDAVTDGLIEAEMDLMQYAESYYFLEDEEDLSLAVTLPYALELAEAGGDSASREVRLAADMLTTAVESLATRLDQSYLRTGSAAPGVLAAYMADHRHGSRA